MKKRMPGTRLLQPDWLDTNPGTGGGASLQDLKAATRSEDYDPNAPAPVDRNVPVKPLGSLTQRDATLRDRLTDLMAKPLSAVAPDDYAARTGARNLMSLGEDFNPLIGAPMAVGDMVDAYKRNDKDDMQWAALSALMNVGGGGLSAKALNKGKSFVWGELDPFRPKVR
jgi:hypothetical protein